MRTCKRFTDIFKWNQVWFRELLPDQKLVFLFLVDECDSAGVWEIDLKMCEFKTGLSIESIGATIEVLIHTGRITRIDTGDKLWLTKFIMFQYPKGLKEDYNPHKPIFDSITRNNLDRSKLYTTEPLTNITPTIQGMDMDMDSDSDKEIKVNILDKAIKLWNTEVSPKIIGTPKVKHRTKGRVKRLNQIRARLKEGLSDKTSLPKDADELYPFRLLCEKIKYSPFLTGMSTDWKCTFDWVLNPTNWQKIMDGNFDGKTRIGKVDHNDGF